MVFALDGTGTLTDQLYRAVRGEILAGRLAPGARLPSSRQTATDLGLSRNVALLALERLLAEGYVTARRGAGHFVAAEIPDDRRPGSARQPALRTRASAARAAPRLTAYARAALDAAGEAGFAWVASSRSPLCDFRYGGPSYGDFPHATWCRILARRARRATVSDLDYGRPEGLPALRETLAAYLGRARGVACSPEQVIVVSGSQQALDLAARVLVEPGDTVLIEDPHYRPARVVFEAAGAAVRPVAVDAEGLPVDQLPSSSPCRLIYVTPSHQFPTGVVLPLARRLRLLSWAERVDAYVFEDDYDSEFRYGGRPITALQGLDQGGRVIYAGSFSKVMFPGLRLGYLVVPEALVPAFRVAKALADAGSSPLPQLALADFIRDGHFERHIRRSRMRNGARRAALLDAFARHLGDDVRVAGANAGLHVLAWLPRVPFAQTTALRRAAAAAGVRIYSAGPFHYTPPAHCGLVFGYAALTEREIADGVRRLAPLIERASGRARSAR